MTPARKQNGNGLVGNSFSLLAATHFAAIFGYLFWMICARSFSAGVIGVTNTVISAMTLIAILTVSGFIPMLTRLLPGASAEERSGLCSTALVVTATVTALAGCVGAMLLPNRVHEAVGTGWLLGVLAVGTVGTAMLLVINAALLGIQRAELSLIGSIVASVTRLSAIAAILMFSLLATGAYASASHAILVIWVVSLIIAIVISVWLLARAIDGFRFRPGRKWLYRLRSSMGWDHIATLAIRTPVLVIPIMAAALFPPAQVGYLAVIVMIGTVFLAVSSAVSNALLADCASDPDRLRWQVRRAVRLIAILLFIPVLVTCLLAKELLGIFGADYVNYSPLLILVLLSTFPDALINIEIAIMRVRGGLREVAFVTVAGAAMSVGGGWLLMPHLGIFGAAIAVLASQLMVATVFSLVLRRQLRAHKTAPSGPADANPDDSPTIAHGTDSQIERL